MTHYPVMLPEVLEHLNPTPGYTYLDATFGRGGYTRAILETGASVIGLDRDPTALDAANELYQQFSTTFQFFQQPFSELASAVAQSTLPPLQGIVFDLGVSSPQLDVAERGFSFQKDGPLNMRMDSDNTGETAADVVNTYSEKELIRIFRDYGEEKFAGRIARKIIAVREETPFTTTMQLASLIHNVIPSKLVATAKIDPATKVFQALRIHVNDELGELKTALQASYEVLPISPVGGKLVVVSFHALEDRLVKQFTKQAENPSRYMPVTEAVDRWQPAQRRAVLPSEAEVKENVRSRSARLRSATKIA